MLLFCFFAVAQPGQPEAVPSSDLEVDLGEVAALEELLGFKLAEFLSADYSCSLCQLASSVRPHLYRGPSSSSSKVAKIMFAAKISVPARHRHWCLYHIGTKCQPEVVAGSALIVP